jgi:hypothetical protein
MTKLRREIEIFTFASLALTLLHRRLAKRVCLALEKTADALCSERPEVRHATRLGLLSAVKTQYHFRVTITQFMGNRS